MWNSTNTSYTILKRRKVPKESIWMTTQNPKTNTNLRAALPSISARLTCLSCSLKHRPKPRHIQALTQGKTKARRRTKRVGSHPHLPPPIQPAFDMPLSLPLHSLAEAPTLSTPSTNIPPVAKPSHPFVPLPAGPSALLPDPKEKKRNKLQRPKDKSPNLPPPTSRAPTLQTTAQPPRPTSGIFNTSYTSPSPQPTQSQSQHSKQPSFSNNTPVTMPTPSISPSGGRESLYASHMPYTPAPSAPSMPGGWLNTPQATPPPPPPPPPHPTIQSLQAQFGSFLHSPQAAKAQNVVTGLLDMVKHRK